MKKLDQQEKTYTAELDAALVQYAELQQRAADIDDKELDSARQAIRHDKEHEVTQQLQNTYGKLFTPAMLAQSRKDVAGWLDESTAPTSIRQHLQRSHERQDKQHYTREHNQER